MALEVINTVAALVTVSIVAAAAIAALIQLRHLRAGNQISAFFSVAEKLDGREFAHALALIGSSLEEALAEPEFREYEITMFRRSAPPKVDQRYVEMHRAVVLVGNTFELMGLLVKNGIVDPKLFVEQYCGVTLSAWKRLAGYTALGREAGDPNGWELFEYLAVISEDWLNSNPSSYPKGVRRYPLRTGSVER